MSELVRVVRVYKPCKNCEGTGLTEAFNYLEDEVYDVTCEGCYGKGDVIETVAKKNKREVDKFLGK